MAEVSTQEDKIQLDPAVATKAMYTAFGVGIVALLAAFGLSMSDPAKFFRSYIVAFMYALSIGLGALFFVTIQHLTNAYWSVVVRRVAELLSLGLLALAILSLALVAPMLMGTETLQGIYVWLDHDAVQQSHLLHHKAPYLNATFFGIRWAVYVIVWCGLAYTYFKKSVDQDKDGDEAITRSLNTVSAPGIILFALTLTFAAFDILMSLDPEWFSTIFGVYYFAGCVLAGYSVLGLSLMWLQGKGCLLKSVNQEHYHDIGKMMFGFTIFWAYIGFSQFMLIWYGDIPEETHWFHYRFRGEWATVSTALLVGHFVIPFFYLMSRWRKRSKPQLAVGAFWILGMHYVDLFWLVYPHGSDTVPFSVVDLLTVTFTVAFFFGFVLSRTKGVNLIPTKDPKLGKSLAFENL
jgi:hypothetical protein